MSTVVSAAQALVRAIRTSAEYQEWEARAKNVQTSPRAEKQLTTLRQLAFEVQALQLQGQKVPADKVKALDQTGQQLSADPVLGPYLQAEARLSQILAQVQETLAGALQIPKR